MHYYSKMDINQLICGLKNKDIAAFSVLYDDYAGSLLGVAFKIVNNKVVSEEILQDVFIKIWKHIDSYDATKGALFTWMLNITRNTCKDYFRSKHYQYQARISEEELDRIPSEYVPQITNSPEDRLDLALLMGTLEPKYKEIIDLVYIYGYSQEQVSEKLNLPLGTVKTRNRTALKQLRYSYML